VWQVLLQQVLLPLVSCQLLRCRQQVPLVQVLPQVLCWMQEQQQQASLQPVLLLQVPCLLLHCQQQGQRASL
jgi:hypothetical protein